jgi:hypothetical protein
VAVPQGHELEQVAVVGAANPDEAHQGVDKAPSQCPSPE